MNRKIIISFSITIFLLVTLGVTSVIKMMELSELTQKLYKHPYTVSNATKTIKINLISMHRGMKDVIHAQNMNEMQSAMKSVKVNENKIYREFEIIFERYLGDREDIQKCYDAFVDSELIRDEVILLVRAGKLDEARMIARDSGFTYVNELNKQVDKMIDYANNKAIYFKNNALENELESITSIVVMLGVILIIVISNLIILLKNITKNERKIKEHFHMIDQNIMSAKCDVNCKIIEVSNALARHLEFSRQELLLKGDYFLLSDCDEELQSEIKRTIHSGKEWRGEISKLDSLDNLKWLSTHITPLLDAELVVVGYTNILHDISAKKEVEAISKIDGLTNIYNRRFFDETFPKMIKIAHRQEKFLCFAMIDIDHFKNFNDSYGHQAGDAALKKVALSLNQSLNRPDDYAFRLGGEEFGMLYMVQKEEDALKIATKINIAIEGLKILHSLNSASEFITISTGLYIIDLDNQFSAEEIYAKCDEALYKAKESGRNRVVKA